MTHHAHDLTALAVPESLRLLRGVLPEPPAAVCEVGCGRGALAAALVDAGYDVTGLEPDEETAARARRRGVPVLVEDLRAHDAPGRYDVVLFTRSLHHIEDLPGAIAHARTLLRDGGLLVLEEFAREAADPSAARFLFDTRTLLDAAGRLEPHDDDPADEPVDPWERWCRHLVPSGHDTAEELAHKPFHAVADIVGALAAAGFAVRQEPTATLWRMVAQGLAESPVAAEIAETVRAVEYRRIADGSLPALGRFLVATPQPSTSD